ncbi:MAG: extracellular solute-binding protein [Pseudomonadota bacterium]
MKINTRRSRIARTLLVAATSALALTACAESVEEEVAIVGEVNIYSSRHYDTDLALYEDFTKATGIKVNRIESGADALIERILAEGEYSPADLLITVDAGRLWRAVDADVLAPIESETLTARVPENLRHPDGLWFGLSTRARVIVANADLVDTSGLTTYADLADPAYTGQVCMRSSSNIYNISLLSSVIARAGEAAAQDWAAGIVANFKRPPQGNDTANMEAVANGECGVTLANTYYLARFADKPEVFDKLTVIFPNQGEGDIGTHVNVSGAGLTKSAPNRKNAIKFLEYLTDNQAQQYFANGNNEYPVVEGVAPTSFIAGLGEYRADTLSTATIGVGQAKAVAIYDTVGWN